ncbi:hypothetical protein [Stieleria mannarensis]|uniref:hypothetical protein n=1 Tax=Stieleria mannarensis TaxID=2755585 RepID=UPI0016033632|nr:hypothetical protein [Rhodopirellula sp. JC639]
MIALGFCVALLAAAPAAEESIRVRNDALLEQVEQDWRYPKTGYSGRGRTGSIRTLVQHAEATYDKVWQHYADRCGFDQRFDEGLFVLGREVDDTVDRRRMGLRFPQRSKGDPSNKTGKKAHQHPA